MYLGVCMCKHALECMYGAHKRRHRCPQRPEEGTGSPEAGITGGHELSDNGDGIALFPCCFRFRT